MKKIGIVLTALSLFLACEVPTIDVPTNAPVYPEQNLPAASTIDGNGYPEQRMQFVSASDGDFLTAGGVFSGASVIAEASSSTLNQWVLKKAGNDYYQIVNVASGSVLAPNGNAAAASAPVVTTNVPSGGSQYWRIVPVQSDANADALYYKIVNHADTRLALTLSNGAFVLSSSNNSPTQAFRLDAYGAQGFAGYCLSMNGRDVASITGGVLGNVVTASNVSQLKSYASGTTPYTIVINGNISASSLTKVNVGKNKTFVGSFNTNTLNNIHFRCISNSGNLIFKNITFSHNRNINANDDIQVYINTGNKYWIDHCTFTGHQSTTANDVDKLIYVGLTADYVSVTGCKLMGHKYGLILGYYNEDGASRYAGYPRMTIANNYFYNVQTRAPGLMRYGFYHCYNNYVYGFNLGYTPYTGCTIYSENNYFDKGSYKGNVVDIHQRGAGSFTDSGSVLSSSISNLQAIRSTSWRPSANYDYDAKTAAEVPAWCKQYAGVQSTSIVYAIDSSF